MRQVGVLAAAGLYALDHHLERIPEDHVRARRLAAGLRALAPPGLEIDEPDTNMVRLRLASGPTTAGALCDALAAEGVALLPLGPELIRAVTHLDVGDDDIDRAVSTIDAVLRRVGRPSR